MKPSLAVAFSGGLDTSFLVAWYADQGYSVTAIHVDTGAYDPEEQAQLESHAVSLGATAFQSVAGKQPLFDEAIAWLIRGNVLRGQVYPLCVGVERVVQARLFAQAAIDAGIGILVHGSTGAGNDQVRFDVTLRAVAPNAQVWAPIRDQALTREATSDWLTERGLGPMQKDAAVSINSGLWGTTAGGRETHDSWLGPSEESFPTTRCPSAAPSEGCEVVITFDEGLPVAVDGEPVCGFEAIEVLAKLGVQHGVGRGIHLGDTILGIKGRVAFEAPAAAILIPAHRELEKLTLTSDQRFWKDHMANVYGQLVHEARFLDPLARDIEAMLHSSQKRVRGDVRVSLRQGAVMVTGVRSDLSLMAVQQTAYGEHTELWTGEDARGFTKIAGTSQWLASAAWAAGVVAK